MSNGFPPGPWNGGGEWGDEGTLALTESPAPGPLGFSVGSTRSDDNDAPTEEADVPSD
jgi:hypothetical protein